LLSEGKSRARSALFADGRRRAPDAAAVSVFVLAGPTGAGAAGAGGAVLPSSCKAGP